MSVTPFSDLECQTLLALWNKEDFWQYFYLLSDRFIEDGDEDGARFVRWLSVWKQRPAKGYSDPKYNWWYLGIKKDKDPYTETIKQLKCRSFCNLLPPEFYSVCICSAHTYKSVMEWVIPTEGLQAALHCWRTFSEATKIHIETNWRR